MDTPSPDTGSAPRQPVAPQPGSAPGAYPQQPGSTPGTYPQQPSAAPSAYPQQPGTAAPRRGHAGWWIAGILVALLLLSIGGCAAALIAVGTRSGATGAAPTSGPGIALIHLSGTIQDGGASSSGASPERFVNMLRQADKDPDVRAILLRIDSPGGTVSASQEIAMEVARMDKPVIADIGDTGASGAYYVASQCDTIVATPSSAVGSIGVILEVPNIEELMKKLGVKVTVVHEGEFKDAGSPFRSLTPTETTMIKADMKPAYDEFIAAVAKGRNLPEAKVRELATGWVWPGVTAKELGLVDQLGNYADAVAVAGAAGKLGADPRVIDYDRGDVFGALSRLLSSVERLDVPGALDAWQRVPR